MRGGKRKKNGGVDSSIKRQLKCKNAYDRNRETGSALRQQEEFNKTKLVPAALGIAKKFATQLVKSVSFPALAEMLQARETKMLRLAMLLLTVRAAAAVATVDGGRNHVDGDDAEEELEIVDHHGIRTKRSTTGRKK